MNDRNLQLDFVKGFLVIVMVIYHTMNYFSLASAEDYGYIRFINGSFVFISGYIVSTFYKVKYQIDKRKVHRRLIIRGFKLLMIFTVLNLLINIIGLRSYKNVQFGLPAYLDNLGAIYVSGNSRLTAFQILVPMSYLLMVSPIYIMSHRMKKALIAGTLMLPFFYMALNMRSYNLYLGIIGLIGICVGMLFNADGIRLIRNRFAIVGCFVIVASTMRYLDRNILTYAMGILIVLKLTYDYAKTVNPGNRVYQAVILLGQYTLVCYISQILFLYGLFWLLWKQRWGLGYELVSIFLVTNIFLFALSVLLRFLRDRHKFIDKTYRLIFS